MPHQFSPWNQIHDEDSSVTSVQRIEYDVKVM